MNLRAATSSVDTGGRLALAAAIEARDAAELSCATWRTALTHASENVRAAEDAHVEAKAAVETARVDAAKRAADAASAGQSIGPDPAMRAARDHALDAEDLAAGAVAALASVEAAVSQAEFDRRRAQGKLDEAVRNVVRSALPQILAQVQDAREALARANGNMRVFWSALEWMNDIERRKLVERLLNNPTVEEDRLAAEPLRTWIENLKTDADAAAPI
jgi:hypothetical protein